MTGTGKTVTRVDLCEAVYQKVGLSRTESSAFVELVLKEIAEAFVKRGLVMDGGGAYLLPRRIGMQAAKEMAFFGDKLPAREAYRLGLVNRCVPAEEVDAVVDDLVLRLAAAPTTAIGLTKRLLNDAPDTDRTGSFVAEAMAQELQSHSDDAKEGVRAFVEKRPADFVGW